MAFFASVMLQISIELAIEDDPVYESMALKFFEHFQWIAAAMDHLGTSGVKLWNHADGFYYDVLRFPDGGGVPLQVRSLVGLMPLAASTVLPADLDQRLPWFFKRTQWFLERFPHTAAIVTTPLDIGAGGNRLLSLVNADKLRRILGYLLNESEFLSDYGIRSVSRYHEKNPYVFKAGGQEYRVAYLPADSDSGMFGGNSNWRGPIWFPMNQLLLRGLMNLYAYFGNEFKVECPVGSGKQLNLYEVVQEIVRRLTRIFTLNEKGQRPVFGGHPKWADPNWRDHILFHEYFHGDNGAGVGASHQTGWTGSIAFILHTTAAIEAKDVLERGAHAGAKKGAEEVRAAAGERVAAQVAEAVHEQVAEAILEKVVETVEERVAQAVQEQGAAESQEKIAELVLDKVAKTVQEKVAEKTQVESEETSKG
jgi:hypothetical protein